MIEGTEGGRRPTGVPSIKRAEKDTKIMQNKPRKRRKLPAEKKYAILEEVKQNAGTKAEILRREGLYSADLHRFDEVAREGAIKALGQSRPGRKKKIEQEVICLSKSLR